MRFIDAEKLRPAIREQVAALEKVRDEVLAEGDAEKRAALIKRHQPKWSALKVAFEQFSSDKCWYTECKSPGADNDIDHFRPKLGVKEDATHPGYYWLAFEWTNLRLSCQRANRPKKTDADETAGKAEHFPLLAGGVRALGLGDDLSAERPALMDPMNALDPAMLSFKPNGEIDLSPEFKQNGDAIAKFEATRLCLHLNWAKFRDGRVVLYNKIERDVNRGEREAPPTLPFFEAEESFLNVVRDLLTYMSPEQEYSAAARVYVESFRHLWWIREIVLRVPA